MNGARSPATALLLAAVAALSGCAPQDSIPTYEVTRRSFQHKVTAEGTLKAEKATRVTVPVEV